MSVGAGPPQGAPMLSPDGKWVWDGSRWLPLADPSTATHHAVFAAWNGVRVEAPVAVEAAPVPVPQAPRPAARPLARPVVRYAAPAPAPDEPAPLWRQQTETGLNKYLYIVAGVIAVVVLAVVVNSFGPFTLPWMQSTSSGPTVAAGPPPLATRSGYAQAERFITGFLTPSMDDMNQRIATTHETCVGPVTVSCQDAITETDNQAQALLAIVDHATVPSCIATPVSRFRADVSTVHGDLQATMKSFAANNTSQTDAYLGRYAGAVPAVPADFAAISAAKATCDTA
ncbi:MAG: hypothetical protein ACHP7H_06740, partial [Hyphomicrobiales bacterium]